MKKFILTETEKKHIKNLYGLSEQTQTTTPPTNYTIKQLQDLVISKGVKIVPDNRYGPKTAGAILQLLNSKPTTQTQSQPQSQPQPQPIKIDPTQTRTPLNINLQSQPEVKPQPQTQQETTPPVSAPEKIKPKGPNKIPTNPPKPQLRR